MLKAICLVIGVHDGDTLTVRCGDQPQMRVRLAEIDAPELRQPYGKASKRAASDAVFGKQVELQTFGADRYGRTIGRVVYNGHELNFDQVRAGLAWCYTKYLKRADQCLAAENEAKDAQRGLWSDADAMPPWEWRHTPKR